MRCKYYVDDAFECGPFTGNPAGVCVVEEALSEEQMQNVATENNLAETAFIRRNGNMWDIRWFTPRTEVGICGHATLGAAYVILNYLDAGKSLVMFNTQKNGIVSCREEAGIYYLDFPLRGLEEREYSLEIEEAFSCKASQHYHNPNDPDVIYVLYENAEQVKNLSPKLDIIEKIPGIIGVTAMAPGEDTDYVSRFFAPFLGIPEDPVNGATEMCMIPFWCEKLGKTELTDRQLSKRGGVKYLKHNGDRVSIGGRVRLYLSGEIDIG